MRWHLRILFKVDKRVCSGCHSILIFDNSCTITATSYVCIISTKYSNYRTLHCASNKETTEFVLNYSSISEFEIRANTECLHAFLLRTQKTIPHDVHCSQILELFSIHCTVLWSLPVRLRLTLTYSRIARYSHPHMLT